MFCGGLRIARRHADALAVAAAQRGLTLERWCEYALMLAASRPDPLDTAGSPFAMTFAYRPAISGTYPRSTPPSPRIGRASELAEQSDAPATRRAYASDVRDWTAYATAAGLDVEPPHAPAAIAAYVGHMDARGLAVATVRRRCSALARWHRERGHENPTEDPRVRRVLRGLARARGVAPRRKRAATPAVLRAVMLDTSTLPRDRAILAVGFTSGLRRAELAALVWTDVHEHAEGLVLDVRRGKSDQAGHGACVALPYGSGGEATSPVRVLLRWRAL